MKKLLLLASLCFGILLTPLSIAQAAPFLATFHTGADGDSITLPLVNGYTYNFTVEWGDGSSDAITAYDQAEIVHAYGTAGDYQISITGTMPMWNFSGLPASSQLQITSIDDAGDVGFGVGVQNFSFMFSGCNNLSSVALFDTSSGNNFESIFSGATSLTRGALNGTRYSIDYKNTNLDATAITEIFNQLGTAFDTNQTINITGTPGYASLTSADYTIAEGKSWSVLPAVFVPLASCSDGIMNQDETGIDCGGTSCVACIITSSKFPTSGIDFDRSQMSISVSSNQHSSVQCLGKTLPHTFTLTELGFDDVVSAISDFGDFSTNSCFQQAGDYTIQVDIFDRAGNFSATPVTTITVTSADPNEATSTLTASCPNTVANAEDICNVAIVLRDEFGNEMEQNIDALNIFSSTTTDSADANEGISFRNGLKIGTSNFTAASKIPFSWNRLSPSNWNISALAPSIERINIGDFPGQHLSTVVDKLISFTIENLPSIESNGAIGARGISFSNIPAYLRFNSPIEIEPKFNPPSFSFGEEIEVHSVLNYPTIVNGLSTLINSNLKSISNHKFADPNATTLDEEGNPVVVIAPINIDHAFENIIDLETNAIPRIVYAENAYDTPGDIALVTRASYSIGGTPVEFVAGGLGDALLAAIETVGAVPADVLGFNDEQLSLIQSGVSIEGFVLGDEDQMYLVEADDNKIATLGAVNKKDVREAVSQNAYRLVRNASNIISVASDFNWSLFSDNQNVVIVDLSDKDLSDATLSLSGQLPSGKNTLVVLNGNVTFTGDVTYADMANDSFGLILLRDKAGKYPERGNVFVRANVQQIAGAIAADGGFFSNDSDILANANMGNRDNQLVLNGSLLARNTIGGSRRINDAGQFFTPWETTASQDFAKQYDLHEVRKYYEGGPGSCTNAGSGCDINKSSFVIRIDQKAALLPPPGFSD